jgi:hypothetical protein
MPEMPCRNFTVQILPELRRKALWCIVTPCFEAAQTYGNEPSKNTSPQKCLLDVSEGLRYLSAPLGFFDQLRNIRSYLPKRKHFPIDHTVCTESQHDERQYHSGFRYAASCHISDPIDTQYYICDKRGKHNTEQRPYRSYA